LDGDSAAGTGDCVFAEVGCAGEVVEVVLVVGLEEFEKEFGAIDLFQEGFSLGVAG